MTKQEIITIRPQHPAAASQSKTRLPKMIDTKKYACMCETKTSDIKLLQHAAAASCGWEMRRKEGKPQ